MFFFFFLTDVSGRETGEDYKLSTLICVSNDLENSRGVVLSSTKSHDNVYCQQRYERVKVKVLIFGHVPDPGHSFWYLHRDI